jgi:hypothetical protein
MQLIGLFFTYANELSLKFIWRGGFRFSIPLIFIQILVFEHLQSLQQIIALQKSLD